MSEEPNIPVEEAPPVGAAVCPAPDVCRPSIEEMGRESMLLRLFAPADNLAWCLLVRGLLTRRLRRSMWLLDVAFALLVAGAVVCAGAIRLDRLAFSQITGYVITATIALHAMIVVCGIAFMRELGLFRRMIGCVGGPLHLLLAPIGSEVYTAAFVRFSLLGTLFWLVPAVTFQSIMFLTETRHDPDTFKVMFFINAIPGLGVLLFAWCGVVGGWAMGIPICLPIILIVVCSVLDRYLYGDEFVPWTIVGAMAACLVLLWGHCRRDYTAVLAGNLPK